MSSKRKDARWQLMFDMLAEAGVEQNELPYHAIEKLLMVSEAILTVKGEGWVAEYARRFDEEG